jgi:nucleotide-binding universal stress UspA family protein
MFSDNGDSNRCPESRKKDAIMFKHILVPLDGSPLAEQALPVAARIAQATGGTVTLLYVLNLHVGYGPYLAQVGSFTEAQFQAERASANIYLDRVSHSEILEGVKTRKEVIPGVPAQTIHTYARLSQIDLIVMSSHGYTGFKRWALGSVAQKVAQLGPMPVLILRADSSLSEFSAHPMHILVPLDGSPEAEAALLPAAQLCAALSPEQGLLHLVRVLQPVHYVEDEEEKIAAQINEEAMQEARTYLNWVEQHFREGDFAPLHLQVTSSIVSSKDIAHTLIQVAEQGESSGAAQICDNCNVIALATHGRHGLERLLMGSIAERILGSTKLPFLVVHSQDMSALEQSQDVTPSALASI